MRSEKEYSDLFDVKVNSVLDMVLEPEGLMYYTYPGDDLTEEIVDALESESDVFDLDKVYMEDDGDTHIYVIPFKV